MPRYCCVPFCKFSSNQNTSGVKISFHEFPANADLRRQWLRRVARKDFVPNDKSNSSVVCSKHFTPDDFKVDYTPSKWSRLKKGAVPSVFPKYPSYALLSPVNNDPLSASLNHDSVKKSPIKKYKRKNSNKQIDPAIIYNFEMKSNSNKSTDEHNEDCILINEEEINQDDNSSLLQTLHHIKRLCTENSKRSETSIASNSEMTSTDNNSPKKPDVNSTEDIDNNVDIDLNSNITNNSLPEQSSKANELTINESYQDHPSEQSSVVDESRELLRLRCLLRKMKEANDKLQEKVSFYESDDNHLTLKKIHALEENSPQSNFILDQIDNFFKKRPTWRESTIRECATWVACSPKGYDFAREHKLMVLPCKKTLLRYAYSGEQKVDFFNLGPCQEVSSGESATENSVLKH